LQKQSSCGVSLFRTAGNQVRFRKIPGCKKIKIISPYKNAELLARRIAANVRVSEKNGGFTDCAIR